MPYRSVVLSLALLSLMPIGRAEAGSSLSFSHKDWELVCDNTRTCRAAGYQSDEQPLPVSVLLTRKAGPGQTVGGQLTLSLAPDEDDSILPKVLKLDMRIDGRSLGYILMRKEDRVASLSAAQVSALLQALTRKSDIRWRMAAYDWRLSDQGASAVLLKMDEYQGRLGTAGALIRKGNKGEEAVLPPLPPPVVRVAPLVKPKAGDALLLKQRSAALRASLLATVGEDGCEILAEHGGAEADLSLQRLSEDKLLVSAVCWRAAYNGGLGFWLMDARPPYRVELVTTDANSFSDGRISAAFKGRGIGDCWSSDEWTWDGARFVHSASWTTGMCKLFAGGAWNLPTRVSEPGRARR